MGCVELPPYLTSGPECTAHEWEHLASLLPELRTARGSMLRAQFERHHAELEARLGRRVAVAAAIADFVSLTGRVREPLVISEQQFSELNRLCYVDVKTGLYNYAAFSERLRDELSRAQRYAHGLSLIMMDIDGLKQLNDRKGHVAGDQALTGLADVVRATVRTTDICARFGGDELAVIAPHTDEASAVSLAERMLMAAGTALEVHGVGLSLGVAGWVRGSSATELTDAADQALYRAKRAGGNQVSANAASR